jgi:hypothetical protein
MQYNRSVAQLYASRFLQQPLLQMDKIVRGEAVPQFVELSGHDNNVANVWLHLEPNNFKQ